MPFYKLPSGNVSEIVNPQLNPQLTEGATLLKSTDLSSAQQEASQTSSIPIVPSINTSNLTSIPSINFNTSLPVPPISIANLEVSAPSMPETQGANDLTNRIQQIQSSLMGKSAFTLQKQKEFGIPEQQQTINDLTAQFNNLKRKEAIIQTQYGGALAANQGTLEPFVTGEKDARLRQNAIEALTLASQLDAANGLIGAAQQKVNIAVQEKYGPQEEAIKIAKENLDIALKNPALTIEEKKRADTQILLLKQKEIELTQAKQEQTDIWKTATNAAANISNFSPTNKYPTAALALAAIQQGGISHTKAEALKIASDTGLVPSGNLIRAIANPITGEIEYYYSKGGANASPTTTPPLGTPSGKTNILIAPTGNSGISAVNPLIKPAIETVLGQSYIDLGKLRDSEKVLAAKSSNASGIPLLSAGDSDKVQAANQSYQSASTLIKQISTLTKDVLTASNNQLSMSAQAAKLKAIEIAPTISRDDKAKQFISARASLLSLITRAAGEKGTLTDTDVGRIAAALPSYGDNKDLALQKAANLDSVVKSVFSGSITAYIGSATQNQQNQSQTPIAKEGETKNYNGVNYKVINGVWTPQ